MKFIVLLCLSVTLLSQTSNAQGCVAVRSTGNTCSMDKLDETSKWSLNLNNRYFKSYKHFVGITKATGTKTQGDAAFADYFVNVGATFKF